MFFNKIILFVGLLSISCASKSELYRVHRVVAETDITIDTWTSEDFWLTNIEVTKDSIFFWEQFDLESDTMAMNQGIDFSTVIDMTDSTLVIQQPDQIITYFFNPTAK